MSSTTRHISERINRPASEVYAYASDPSHLPRWASGLAGTVERVGERWFGQTPAGRIGIAFAPRNDFGVLDHDVTLPSGEVVHNPMRVTPDGEGCEITFVLRRLPGVTDDEFARDAATIAADLAQLKKILEA